MKEIGLGITTVLHASDKPEPLYIDLWNQDPEEAAALVRSVLAECHDGGIALKVARVPELVWFHLAADAENLVRPLGSRLEVSSNDGGSRLEFWRAEPT